MLVTSRSSPLAFPASPLEPRVLIAPYIVKSLHEHFENQLNRYRNKKLEAVSHFSLLKNLIHLNDKSNEIENKEITLGSQQFEDLKEIVQKIVAFIKSLNVGKSKEKAIPIPKALLEDISLENLSIPEIEKVIRELVETLLNRVVHLNTKKAETKNNLSNVQEQLEFHTPLSGNLGKIEGEVIKIGREAKEFAKSALNFINRGVGDIFSYQAKDSVEQAEAKLKLQPAYLAAVFDAKKKSRLPGTLVFDNLVNPDNVAKRLGKAVDSAYQNTENVLKFWKEVLAINFVQTTGRIRADSVIHFMKSYVNAFFDGARMVYGDGNQYFRSFYLYLMIAGHEMGHAIVGNKLNYRAQSGALNESYADIFGASAEMYTRGIAAKDYHWEVGKDLIIYKGQTYALRKFTPGAAFINVPPAGGADIQPDGMPDTAWFEKNQEVLNQDNGGVHILSKIPNRVFYIVVETQNDWKEPLLFWKRVMDKIKNPDITFTDFAALQIATAAAENNPALVTQLQNAWKTVGIVPSRISLLAETNEEIIEEVLISEEALRAV